MSVCQCPSCNETVRIPAGASDEATVSCPLCSDEFTIAALLDQLPPALVVVHDPVAEAAASAGVAAGEEIAEGESTSDEGFGEGFSLADDDDTESAGFAGFGDAAADSGSGGGFSLDGEGGSSSSSGSSSRPAPRKKKQSSPIMEVVKVAGGGIVGLVLAQVFLWKVMERDPLKLAKKVAPIAPWLVPAKYRPSADASPSTSGDSTPKNDNQGNNVAQNSGPSGFPQPGQGGFPAPGTGGDIPGTGGDIPGTGGDIPGTGGDIPGTGGDLPGTGGDLPGTGGDLPGTGGLPELNADPFGTGDDPTDPGLPDVGLDDTLLNPGLDPDVGLNETGDDPLDPADPDDLTLDPSPDAGTEEPEVPGAAISGAPTYSFNQFVTTLADATDANDAYDAQGAPGRDTMLKLYSTFAKLADVTALIDLEAGAVQSQAGQLRNTIESFPPAKQTFLAGASLSWMKHAGRDSEGVITAGEVTGFRSEGKLFVAEVRVKSQEIQVVTPFSPQDHCAVGDKVIIMGRIVDDPASNLKGFNGQDPQVIWAGMVAKGKTE